LIIVDSSYFIGLVDKRDQWHKNALNLKKYFESEEVVITDLIVSEVLTEIGKRKGGKEGHILYQFFKDNCKIIYSTEQDFESAEKIYLNFDGKLSISDSLAVHYIYEMAIDRIISFDSDFDKIKNITRIFE
jgi:predicted nucleic acid-binding protein